MNDKILKLLVLVVIAGVYLVARALYKSVDKTAALDEKLDIDAIVILPASENTNGLGTIFGKLFRQVFEQNPERIAILESMDVAIGIQDTLVAATAITMTFRNRAITVENGVTGSPEIKIAGDITALILLPSLARKPASLVFTGDGRDMLKKVLKREIRMQGLLPNIGQFRKFRRLIK